MRRYSDEQIRQSVELTELRQSLGISIKALAKEMDLAESTIGLYFSGGNRCDLKKVKAAMKRIAIRRYEEVMKWE